MTRYLILAFALLFSGCKGQAQKNNAHQESKDPILLVQENEAKAIEKKNENMGELIAKISFQVKNKDKEIFEDGFVPWINIEKAKEEIPYLFKKDEIVIKDNSVKIIIDYPLTNQYEFTLTSNNGFTRQRLCAEISAHYFKLYADEEESATIKTIPIDKRTTMYNRNQTNGKYGIWGHDIADLSLAEILVYKSADGHIILTLGIES